LIRQNDLSMTNLLNIQFLHSVFVDLVKTVSQPDRTQECFQKTAK